MITACDVLMNRDFEFPLTAELRVNLNNLLWCVNRFREAYGVKMYVSSGYRPGHYNKDAHGAKGSAHLICKAVDFHDADGSIKAWIKADLKILERCGLWMEDPDKTVGWVHLDIVPRKERIFKV